MTFSIEVDYCSAGHEYVARSSEGRRMTTSDVVKLANNGIRTIREREKEIVRLRKIVTLLLPVSCEELSNIKEALEESECFK